MLNFLVEAGFSGNVYYSFETFNKFDLESQMRHKFEAYFEALIVSDVQ